MQDISIEESFDWFLTTLSRLDEKNIFLQDCELLSTILDDLDVEATSFLHLETIGPLVKHNLIPASVSSSILELREKLIELIDNKRSVEQIRNDIEWKKARQLAKQILSEINAHTP
jgi:hypothetical protein